MPFKDLEKRKAYRRLWYKNNKESEKAHVKRRKKEIKSWLWEYKKNLKCSMCSESHPSIIDFHHKEGRKEKGVAQMIVDGYSKNRIKEELNKCEVLCANCHRKLHSQNNKV